MTKKYLADLHNHLNGSFSLDFLKKTAEKNKCLEVYKELVQVREDYLRRTTQQPENGFSVELIEFIWKQFALIHKIIQDLTDISDGILDVVQNSPASYLEIRTTPKSLVTESRDRYIDAFESGLLKANQIISSKKAVGLLSLDRTIHTLDDAKHFIERIILSPHKVLAGLDISGNPLATRTLTGNALGDVIHLALNSGTAVAIHMGESDSDKEKEDTDIILSALDQWQSLQPAKNQNHLHGRVRLGHCIFLTDLQKEKISSLGIPIEVCPSCHSKLNWHLEKFPHPVTAIYKDLSDPIVVGTDDEIIFGASIKTEFNSLFNFFSNSKQLSKKALKEHQANFRFSI
jgi:adenosine deaminase